MILLEALGDFHDTAPISGVVGGITGGDDSTNDAVVWFVVEVAVAGEAVYGVADLLDGVVDIDAFQFDEQAGVLLRIGGMMAEEVIALVVGDVGVEVPVNLVFVDDGGVAAQDGELALALLHGKARGATALRGFEADDEVVRWATLWLLVETLTAHYRWQAVR